MAVQPFPKKQIVGEFPTAARRRELFELTQNTPDWLAARIWIGASRIAALVGHDRYADVRLVWREFLGQVSSKDGMSDSFFSEHGHAHEDSARELYVCIMTELMGRKRKAPQDRPPKRARGIESYFPSCSPLSLEGTHESEREFWDRPVVVTEPGIFVSEKLPFLHASPDGCVFLPPGREFLGDCDFGLLEIKNPIYSFHCARSFEDVAKLAVPAHYMIQIQDQLQVIALQGLQMTPGAAQRYGLERLLANPPQLWCDFVSQWVRNERKGDFHGDKTVKRTALIGRVYHNSEFCTEMNRLVARFIHAVRTEREPAEWWDHHPFPQVFKIQPIAEYIEYDGDVGVTRSLLEVPPVYKTLADLDSA